MVTFQASRRGTPANTGAQEQALREVIAMWARGRFGADMRIIHELALGDRRIDMLIVLPADLIGIEVKGPKDRLDDRLKGQLRTFSFYLPEVWLAVDEKWRDVDAYRWCGVNRLAIIKGMPIEEPPTERRDAHRDELCCSRLLELLWSAETLRIARRHALPSEYAPGKSFPIQRVKGMIARMLTGQEIVTAVCAELRARPLTGMASDEPLNAVVTARAPP